MINAFYLSFKFVFLLYTTVKRYTVFDMFQKQAQGKKNFFIFFQKNC